MTNQEEMFLFRTALAVAGECILTSLSYGSDDLEPYVISLPIIKMPNTQFFRPSHYGRPLGKVLVKSE